MAFSLTAFLASIFKKKQRNEEDKAEKEQPSIERQPSLKTRPSLNKHKSLEPLNLSYSNLPAKTTSGNKKDVYDVLKSIKTFQHFPKFYTGLLGVDGTGSTFPVGFHQRIVNF
ncbi:hypothetical protein RF11_04893 [Thelohanellus kitauei]|uniref:Uncharacterized protein n=1 Tax=Thelohanellus kitauei TaxID=669202 RepID=A0A0C2MLU6_THEKT|nr:hypothetical protein RF11_04893 [Thelohanellus kitauei]